MPCSARIFTSPETECPSFLAFSRAISKQIATSPAARATLPRAARGDGNDSTSVGLSFFRNRRLRERNSELFVTNTFTVPRKWTARRARKTKRSRVDGLSPAILFERITNLLQSIFACRSSSRSLLVKSATKHFAKINRRAWFQPSPPDRDFILPKLLWACRLS